MSCDATPATFRLLDGFVGWDAAELSGLAGADDPAGGLVLAAVTPDAMDAAAIDPYLPPARLAPGCGPCAWFLATPAPPRSRLLRLVCPGPAAGEAGGCTSAWVRALDCARAPLDAVAVATRGHLVAVSDAAAGAVLVLGASGADPMARIAVAGPGPIAFTPCGHLLLAAAGRERVLAFTPSGNQVTLLLGQGPVDGEGCPVPHALPRLPAGIPERMGVDGHGAIWLVTREAAGLRLWRAAPGADGFAPAASSALAEALPRNGLAAAGPEGFCLRDPRSASGPTCCSDWYGRPLAPGAVLPAAPPARARRGQLLTAAIDSGLPRCRWHRVRLEASVPPGTGIEVSVATAEDADTPAQGDPGAEGAWKDFPAGVPHHADWQAVPAGLLDFLVDEPPGRHLWLRLRLTGDGQATPTVHRVRLDFPRASSLALLPPVYRDSPAAEDFTERFLSLFDAEVEDLDRAIARFPALLDGAGVPEGALAWLGSFLDVDLDPAWDAARRRAILAAVPELYRRRGTRAGLLQAIRLVLGVDAVIEEAAAARAWGAVGRDARVGLTRLFSPSRARFTLGTSTLGGAPVRGYGDPALDALAAPAWRFRVLVPRLDGDPARARRRLEQLVESQKPAHAVVSLRQGGTGLLVGAASAVGIDTALAALPAPVLGGAAGNVRLSRRTVLWGRHGGAPGPLSVGRTATAGVSTVAA